jgi:hypothetical protein
VIVPARLGRAANYEYSNQCPRDGERRRIKADSTSDAVAVTRNSLDVVAFWLGEVQSTRDCDFSLPHDCGLRRTRAFARITRPKIANVPWLPSSRRHVAPA